MGKLEEMHGMTELTAVAVIQSHPALLQPYGP